MATFNSAGSGNANADATWTEAGQPTDADNAIIASGHTVTLTASEAWRSTRIIGTIAGGGQTLTLSGASSNKPFDNDGTITGDLNLVITNTGAQQDGTVVDMTGSSRNVNDLTLNLANGTTANKTVTLLGATTLDGNLTITSGTLDTDSSSNYALTVTGDCDVLGTLTLNGSTVALGALRTQSGAVMSLDADGTLDLTTGSTFGGTEGANYSWRNEDGTSDINLAGTLTVSGGSYFEPRTAPTYASVVNNWVWNTGAYWVGIITTGTLVVNATKTLQTYGGSGDITVTGDVTVNGTFKVLSGAASTGTMTFGSLTIASGGWYSATSGTTTITSETSGTGRTLSNAGTFTHNKGLVKIDLASPTTTQTQNGPFWDLEQVDASTDFLAEAALTIYNNFTFVGDFDYTNNSHHMVVHGNMIIGDGSTTTRYCAQSAYTNNLTVHGTLEITNGATADLGTHGTVNLGGIRNTGGSIS